MVYPGSLKINVYLISNVATAVDFTIKDKGKYSKGLLNTFIEMILREIMHFYAEYFAATQPEAENSKTLAAIERRVASVFCGTFCTGKEELILGINAHEKGGRIPWQDCVIALDIADIPRYMWKFLSDQEKVEFNAKYRTIMQVYFNAMPLSSATAMLSYLESNLVTLRGQFNDITPLTSTSGEQSFEVLFHPKDDNSGETVHVDFVINAVGFEKSFESDRLAALSPLYHSLLKNGTVTANKLGGLRCDFDSGKLQSIRCSSSEESGEVIDSVPSPQLYGVGHLISGTKMLTSGLSYCTRDAALVVRDLLETVIAIERSKSIV